MKEADSSQIIGNRAQKLRFRFQIANQTYSNLVGDYSMTNWKEMLFSLYFQPGFCNSQFPWYLNAPAQLSSVFGNVTETELCMTDVTNLQKAICCQHPIRLLVRSCGFYSVYKLLEEMPQFSVERQFRTSGRVCAQSIGETVGK